jgi:ureidoacrylate peracid hydrolase
MKTSIDPKSAAVLVIDMQNGFVHPDSAMGRSIGTAPQQALMPKLRKLIQLARARRIPVFWSQQVHLPDDVTRRRRHTASHVCRQGFLPCLRGTFETEFHPEILTFQRPEDHVITKHRASAFFDTNLDTRLRMLGRRTLIIAGCNTEFCVAHTVRDAYARDFDIVVVEDCVAGIQQKFHGLYLELFRSYFGEVIPVGQLSGVLAT